MYYQPTSLGLWLRHFITMMFVQVGDYFDLNSVDVSILISENMDSVINFCTFQRKNP